MNTKTITVEAKADNGYITGYAATWKREPDSWGDVIAKGAFAECIENIKAEGKVIPLLWNHEADDLSAFIGTVRELAEDDHGLFFGAAFDGTDKAQRARELSQDGRLCKLSFAYDVLDAAEVELEDGRKANELRKLNLHEISLVMYPANRDTSVVEVKGMEHATRAVLNADLLADALAKAGRRNSAKDAEELARIAELAASIQSIVDGLLADARADDAQPEPEADDAKANAEEPDTANAEEPDAKDAEVTELLAIADQLLTKKEG